MAISHPSRRALPRDGHVVERQDHVPDDLTLLMPLARDQHDILGPSLAHSCPDRRTPVADFLSAARPSGRRTGSPARPQSGGYRR